MPVYTVRILWQTGRLQDIALGVKAEWGESKRAKTLAGGGAWQFAQNAGVAAGLPLFFLSF